MHFFFLLQTSLLNVIPNEYVILNKKLDNFNHFDFIWGMNSSKIIYSEIVSIAKRHYINIFENLTN